MQIAILFRFNHEHSPLAITGVARDVTDVVLPAVGDIVRHRDLNGDPFEGRVTERIFEYGLGEGEAVDGTVNITLCLESLTIN